MYKLIVTLALLSLIFGCATSKQLTATGGSKADGTVRLSYEHSPYEAPQVDMKQALTTAQQRCRAWGYTDADPFGGTTRVCNMPSGLGGCNQWLVTAEYQCLNK